MLINFPNQLTSEEEQLLKKIAKMKKKKKLFIEKKSKDSQAESQTAASATSASAAAAAAALKKTSKATSNPTQQIDAKEAAKKLIQSGVIKLEIENKEKGFKRSCSRKDDVRKTSVNLNQDTFDSNNRATYSSVNSPQSAKSPPFSPGGMNFYNSNKYSSSDSLTQYSRPSSFGQNQKNFRKNSFQNSSYNQTPNSTFDSNNQGGNGGNGGGNNNKRFHNQNNFHFNQQNPTNQNGVSLYVKANNLTEELLRSIFNANVSNAKLLSIDIKTNFAFVMVDSNEAAENAIQELNGKTFQENLYSVSLARPRKTFNRNFSYGANFDRSNSFNNNNNNNNKFHQNPNPNDPLSANNNSNFGKANNLNDSSSQKSSGSGTNSPNPNESATVGQAPRPVINYEDI